MPTNPLSFTIDLHIQWFSIREPHNADGTEIVATTLNHEKDTLSIWRRYLRPGLSASLPAGLANRMKGGIKSWRKVRAAQAEQEGLAGLL